MERWCIDLVYKKENKLGKPVLKHWILSFTLFCLGLLCFYDQHISAEATEDSTQSVKVEEEIYEHQLLTENENLALYLKEDTLSILLLDKKTGAIMESTLRDEKDDGSSNQTWIGYMKSGLVCNVIDQTNDTLQADFLNNQNTIKVTYLKNGFRAQIYFTDYEFGMDLEVTLQEDGILVLIPDESIVEDSDRYYIGSISPYPMLGYSFMDEKEGYMFVPDGNGALIYLDDKDGRYTSGFSQMVYGEDIGFKDSQIESLFWGRFQTVTDSEKVLAPVFGMVHTKDQIGYLGIIEGGQERASIEAHPNGANIAYNRTFAKFIMRKVYVQPTSKSSSGSYQMVEKDRSHFDIQLRYVFVHEEAADYAGLAVAYRNYLLEKEQLAKKEDSYSTRIDFLGSEREDFLIFKKAVPMTTVEQVKEIYEKLQAAGIESVFSLYKGWQNGGLYSLPVTSVKPDSSLGSKADLITLIQESEEKQYQLYLYQDGLRINPDENNTTFNVVKRINKRQYEEYTYQDVYERFLYLTPVRSEYVLKKLADNFVKNNITNVALSGISNQLFSYTYAGKVYGRTETMSQYLTLAKGLQEKMDLALEQPFSYLWNETDVFLDMPVGSSSYIFVDEEIPFFSIVLKGIMPVYSEYINFEANKEEFFLKLVEMGMYPSFYITYEDSSDLIYTNSSDIYSSRFTSYEKDIKEYDSKLRDLNEKLQGAYIVEHEKLSDTLVKVSYDNGIVIYVNYSDQSQDADGLTIEGLDFKVGEIHD